MSTNSHSTDIAIIGGGIMGSATAYFLKTLSPSLVVTVIEADPSYEFCSTLRASGGARRLFSCPENIEMSNYSIDFIKAFPHAMAGAIRMACCKASGTRPFRWGSSIGMIGSARSRVAVRR